VKNIGFGLFCCVIALHHFPTFFILYFHVFSVTRCHHSYNEMASFAFFFVFVRHTTHCFGMLHVLWLKTLPWRRPLELVGETLADNKI